VWQDKERVESARFSLDHAILVPSTSARVVHSKPSFLTSHRRVAPKPIRRVLQQPEHDEESRRQSSRTHAVIPAGSIDSPSRAGFAFPVGQSPSRLRRALSRCAATCSAETLSALVPRHRARHHPRAPQASLRRRRVRPRFPPHRPSVPRTPAPSREDVATIELKLPDLVASYPKLIDAVPE
jgi:hypothetical protein